MGKMVLRLLVVGAMTLAMAQSGYAAPCKKVCKTVIKDCQTLVGTPKTGCTGQTGAEKKACRKAITTARKACKTSALAGCKAAGDGTCPAVGSASGSFAFVD